MGTGVARASIISFAVLLLAAASAFAQPAQVILIRHAEKPDDPDDIHLNTKGRQRAAALVPYFQETPELLKFGPPAAIYAARPGGGGIKSQRCPETVQGLAKALKVEVLMPWRNDDYAKLAKEILAEKQYAGKMVLVCWHHSTLPELAREFKAPGVPATWPDRTYDRTWVLTFPNDGPVVFENLPQRLMFGDSKK